MCCVVDYNSTTMYHRRDNVFYIILLYMYILTMYVKIRNIDEIYNMKPDGKNTNFSNTSLLHS